MKEKERKVILLAVLVHKTVDEKRELNELLNQELDWGYIGGILINHRLSGYFLFGVETTLHKKIPKEMKKVLEMIVLCQKDKQLRLIDEISQINAKLSEEKIRFAALKGAFFGVEMYKIGIRRSNDIDFLVYEEDLTKLDVVLRSMGYIQSNLPEGELIEASKKEKLIQRLNHHDLVPYVKQKDGDLLEVDINFLFQGKDNPIDKQIYELGTREYKGEYYCVNALNPMSNLAFLCVHFYREATNTIWTNEKRDVVLYKIVDIINFIRTYENEIKWIDWYDMVEELDLKNPCYFTFKILSLFYNDKKIESIIENIHPQDDEFMEIIYDNDRNRKIKRKESFYDAAFNLIF